MIAKAFDVTKPTPMTVYRGVDGMSLKMVNDIIQQEGVFKFGRDNYGATTSTSWHAPVSVQGFMHGYSDPSYADNHKVLFQIHQKSAIAIEHISGIKSEAELLIPKEAKFKVLNVSRWKGRKRVLIIELEEI